MGGPGCCDSCDHGDPHRLPWPVSDSRHDDTKEPNAPRLIYLARWNTNKTKTDSSFPFVFTLDPDK